MKKPYLKTVALALVGLLFGSTGRAETITIQSELVPTCYQLPNTAVFRAIRDAEEKARKNCSYPVLIVLNTEIKADGNGGCGFVRVTANYSCR